MIDRIDFGQRLILGDLADQILAILHKTEGNYVIVDCNVSPLSTCRLLFYDLKHDHQTQLNVKYFAPWKSMTIQSVYLEKRHQGTMTKILNLIKENAERCNIDKIIIESVLSPEMSHCALKNGFQIQESSGSYVTASSFFNENDEKETFFGGNYVYLIRGEPSERI